MNHTLNPEPPQKPWYRYGWVWFLISIPGSAVIVGSITIWIAFTKGDTLVADDYYKEGRAINQRLEKDAEAASRGILIRPSVFRLADGNTLIQVQYQAAAGQPAPEFIRLRMSHPTLDERDVLATLNKVTTPEIVVGPSAAPKPLDSAVVGAALGSVTHYQTRIPSVLAGRWHAQLEDENSVWRVKSIWVVE
jgi:uncharacterized protein